LHDSRAVSGANLVALSGADLVALSGADPVAHFEGDLVMIRLPTACLVPSIDFVVAAQAGVTSSHA
jgi:hypothetical protein